MKKIRIKFLSVQAGDEQRIDKVCNVLSDRYEFIISDDPEYVVSFSSVPDFLEYDCIRIELLGENLRPDFNVCDYAAGFDSIQFDDRYIRWPQYASSFNFPLALKKNILQEEVDYLGRKFCNMVVSNGNNADNFREVFYEQLNDYIHIDSGGKFKNNVGGPILDKLEFQKRYKFSLAFENSVTKSYITEKIIDAWAAQTIPIYYGAPDVATEFNQDAFIDFNDYNSADSFIGRIKEINEDDKQYMDILRTPIYTNDSRVKRYMDQTLICKFFDHIFSQEYHKAKRRQNDIFWGRNYEYRLRDYNDLKSSQLVKLAHCIDYKMLGKRDIWHGNK